MSNYDVVVVAGGWSVSQFDKEALNKRLTRTQSIGVNDSALLLACRNALSMDRLWTEGRWATTKALFKLDRIWIRKGVVKNMTLPDEVHQFEHTGDTVSMATELGKLNGSNSGTCAVNLAYQWCRNSVGLEGAARASNRKVFLLGFDMQDGPNGEKHWYPNYPWRPNGATKPGNFQQWAREFWSINECFKQIGVPLINVNFRSAIKDLCQITPEEFLEMK